MVVPKFPPPPPPPPQKKILPVPNIIHLDPPSKKIPPMSILFLHPLQRQCIDLTDII